MTSSSRRPALLVTIVLAGVLAACSSTASGTGASGTTSASGAPGGSEESRCVGSPVEAYSVGDRETCRLQGSDWSDTTLSCDGTTFRVNCARGDESFSSLPDEAKKSACLDIIGCGWTEPDGTVTKPSGRCDGTKTKCSSFATEETCRKQPGCIFYTSTKCSDLNSRQYLNNVDCGSLNFGPTLSVSVARSQCKRTIGCTWTD